MARRRVEIEHGGDGGGEGEGEGGGERMGPTLLARPGPGRSILRRILTHIVPSGRYNARVEIETDIMIEVE